MQKTLANIRDRYTKGIITAEEAVQKSLSTMTYYGCSFPDLDNWCTASNNAIDDFNQAVIKLCEAYKKREETFKTLWDTINK